MTHAARGFFSLAAKSSSEEEPMAPSLPNSATVCGLRSETTHSCPPRISRRTMLPPIRPSPTIPSCIVCRSFSNLARATALEIGTPLPDRLLQSLQASSYICSQMHAQRATLAIRKNLEVTTRLRGFNHAESVFLPG